MKTGETSASDWSRKAFLRMSALSLQLALMLFAMVTGQLFAQTTGAGAAGKPPRFSPEVRKTEDGVSYVSTGIGFDSRANLPRFALKLVFATKTSSYLANIDAEITPGPTGKPIRIHSLGPWLLVDLPPGKYTVAGTTAKGHKAVKQVEIVKGRVTQVKLVWNLSDEEI